jgi:hypothetical protein
MKKLLTLVTTLLLAGSLAFAQTTPSGSDKTTTPAKTESGKKASKSGKKGHKGGKKSKKNSSDTTTTPK